MRLELRDNPKEPVAKLWLERGSNSDIVLYYQIEGELPNSLAYFNEEENRFHVFAHDVSHLGYRVTTTGVDIKETLL